MAGWLRGKYPVNISETPSLYNLRNGEALSGVGRADDAPTIRTAFVARRPDESVCVPTCRGRIESALEQAA